MRESTPPVDPDHEPEIIVDETPEVDVLGTAANTEQIAACLTRVSLFADLPAVYLRRIASLGVEEAFARRCRRTRAQDTCLEHLEYLVHRALGACQARPAWAD